MFKSKYIKSFTAGLVLASGLFMSSGSSLAAKDFTDLYSDMSHVNGVNYLNSLNVFDYKTGNKLNGNQGVTRAEAAKVLHNLYGNDIPPERQYNNNFKDVNNNTEFKDSIAWAYESLIMDGDTNGNFNPNKVLTRAQMAKILVNTFLLDTEGAYKFKDVPTNHWAYEYINILGAEGISIGSNGNFMPDSPVTLNQLSTFIHRIIEGAMESGDVADIKTYEEVYQIAVDLYNSKPFKEQEVVVMTKEDMYSKFMQDNLYTNDISEDVKGFVLHGKYLSVVSTKISDNLYKTTIAVTTQNDEQYEQELENKIANAAEYIKSKYDVSTDYKKVVAVNEFLADQMTYGEKVENHKYLPDAWSWSACQDYADALSLILSEMGVQTRYITGNNSKGNGHAWNAVKLDGEWYYTDSTNYDYNNGNSKFLLMTQSELDTYITKIDTDFRATNTPYTNK